MEAAINRHGPVAEEGYPQKIYETNVTAQAQTSDKDEKLERTESERQLRTSDETVENDVRAEPDELLVKTIMSYNINRSRLHAHAKFGEVLYLVRCRGYLPSEDTWEPIVNLTRNPLINYHKKKRLNMPTNLNATINDREASNNKTPNDLSLIHI